MRSWWSLRKTLFRLNFPRLGQILSQLLKWRWWKNIYCMQIKWDIDLQHLLIYNYYTCIVLCLSSNATSFVDDLYCFFKHSKTSIPWQLLDIGDVFTISTRSLVVISSVCFLVKSIPNNLPTQAPSWKKSRPDFQIQRLFSWTAMQHRSRSKIWVCKGMFIWMFPEIVVPPNHPF